MWSVLKKNSGLWGIWSRSGFFGGGAISLSREGGDGQGYQEEEADDGGDAGIDEYWGQILDSEVMGACFKRDGAQGEVGEEDLVFLLHGTFTGILLQSARSTDSASL